MNALVDNVMKQVLLSWFILVPAFFVGMVSHWLVLPFVILSTLFVNWYTYGHAIVVPLKPIIDDCRFLLGILAFSYAFWLFLLFVKF